VEHNRSTLARAGKNSHRDIGFIRGRARSVRATWQLRTATNIASRGEAMRADRTRRGRPTFAANQREKILELLRASGPRGVSREELIFRYRWTQCGTRIFELQKMGFVIRSDDRGGRYPTWYVLLSEPLELKPLVEAGDWYDSQHGPRPSHRSTDLPPSSGLPLFDAVVRR